MKGQMLMKFYKSSTEIWWNKESNERKIEWFGHKIREKSLFENQQKSALKFGQKDENYDL